MQRLPMSSFGPDEWAERERLDHIAQQDAEERVASERELHERLTVLEAQIQELNLHLAARDHALRFVSEHAEIATRERDQLKAAVGKFRTYLDQNFRQWCNLYGLTNDYATKLIAELDRMTDLDRPADADLCVCGHAHGQHADPDACFALDNGDMCDCDGFKTASHAGEVT